MAKRIPMPEQLKYGFEDPNDVYEIELVYEMDGVYHFQQYKNSERIRGSVTLKKELLTNFGIEIE